MRVFGATLSVLLLAIRPFRYSPDVWGWGEIVTVILTVLGLGGVAIGGWFVGILLNLPRGITAVVFGVSGFAVLLLIAGIRLQLQIQKEPKPNIVFDEPYIWSARRVAIPHPPADREHVLNIKGKQVFSNYYVLRAKVRNTPDNPMQEAKAGQAVITIDFFSEDNSNPILTIDGRWSDNPQAGTHGLHVSLADLRKRDLLPNSDYHEIDIAVKAYEDSDWFATNDYAERQAPDGKYQPYKLQIGCILVAITIKAVGLKEPSIGWVRIGNHGKDTAPTIELLK